MEDYDVIEHKKELLKDGATPYIDVTGDPNYVAIDVPLPDGKKGATAFINVGGDTPGGGGAVDSVNGQTGTVVLTANDVNAYNKGEIDAQQLVQDDRLDEIEAILTTVLVSGTAEPEPVIMTGTPVKVFTFDPISTTGKYKGAFRATFNGTGIREVTTEVYINSVASGQTQTLQITDNDTVTFSTVEPIDFNLGDVVELYVTCPNGDLTGIEAILELSIGKVEPPTGGGTVLNGELLIDDSTLAGKPFDVIMYEIATANQYQHIIFRVGNELPNLRTAIDTKLGRTSQYFMEFVVGEPFYGGRIFIQDIATTGQTGRFVTGAFGSAPPVTNGDYVLPEVPFA